MTLAQMFRKMTLFLWILPGHGGTHLCLELQRSALPTKNFVVPVNEKVKKQQENLRTNAHLLQMLLQIEVADFDVNS